MVVTALPDWKYVPVPTNVIGEVGAEVGVGVAVGVGVDVIVGVGVDGRAR